MRTIASPFAPALVAGSLLFVLGAAPARAQFPNLGDIASQFRKPKSKPVSVTVNGVPADDAIQQNGTVYVPLSVLQALPGVACTLDTGKASLAITTSSRISATNVRGPVAPGKAAPPAADAKYGFHVLPGVSLDPHSLYLYTDGLGQAVVHGDLKNITDHSLPSVWVSVAFLEGDGNRVQELPTGTSDLGPGETWKFKVGTITGLQRTIKSYKILWISDNVLGPSNETPPATP